MARQRPVPGPPAMVLLRRRHCLAVLARSMPSRCSRQMMKMPAPTTMAPPTSVWTVGTVAEGEIADDDAEHHRGVFERRHRRGFGMAVGFGHQHLRDAAAKAGRRPAAAAWLAVSACQPNGSDSSAISAGGQREPQDDGRRSSRCAPGCAPAAAPSPTSPAETSAATTPSASRVADAGGAPRTASASATR